MKKIDLHQDIVLLYDQNHEGFGNWENIEDPMWIHAGHLKDFIEQEIHIVWAAIWPYDLVWSLSDPNRKISFNKTLIEQFSKSYYKIAEKHNLSILKDTSTIQESWKNHFFLHLEWADHINSLSDIDELYALWIRSIWFVWNFDNTLASCNLTENDRGLSKLWIEAIQKMNTLGIAVDTAHMSHKSMMDALKYSQKPIFNTHSNIKNLHKHPRNLEDEFLIWLEKNGGTVWLSICQSFISWKEKKSSLEDYLNNISYIRNLIWDENISLGTDYFGLTQWDIVVWLEKISWLSELERLVVEKFWLDFAEKFFYKNAVRVLKTTIL